ncbi:MAG TPA: energy transducer TonB [Albitalea sp.]|nr:energy transducer TonB [Albitalea sp.]
MSFSRQQVDPRRHAVGLSFVVLLHLAVVYALVTGLAKKVIDVARAPIEAKVIEELKKPPPPPEEALPPPPKMEAPPPPFVPPPEVQIQPPLQPQPSITAQQATPPPQEFKPTPSVAAAPAQPAPVAAAVACSNYASVMGDLAYPREAVRQGIEQGAALVQFTVSAAGDVKDIRVVSATHPIFARASARIVGEYKCQGQGRDVLVQVPFGYRLE